MLTCILCYLPMNRLSDAKAQVSTMVRREGFSEKKDSKFLSSIWEKIRMRIILF